MRPCPVRLILARITKPAAKALDRIGCPEVAPSIAPIDIRPELSRLERLDRGITLSTIGQWMGFGVVADRHYANGNMRLFGEWVRVGKRVDELLPWRSAVD